MHHLNQLTSVCLSRQTGKALGERWQTLDEEQRAPYKAKAAAGNERYEMEELKYHVSYANPHMKYFMQRAH
jgi:hypothetical protein